MTWTIYPAIDVRDGRVVRLVQGDYAQQTTYADDPLVLAQRYADAGAQWLHLVDLDAARVGGYTLLPLVEQIKTTTALHVQSGGGLRTEADVAALLNAGVDRAVLGTVAIRAPDDVTAWMKQFGPDRLTLALDVRRDDGGRWRLPIRGWTEDSPTTLDELLDRYLQAGLRHLLCTDISRDGMLNGFNLDLYRQLHERWPTLAVQASGGVTGLSDIAAARAAGAGGAVLGRALLEGRFGLAEALAC